MNNPNKWIDPSGYAPNKSPVERQITYDACLEALIRNLNPRCDIPSSALEYIIQGIVMVLTPDEAAAYGVNPSDVTNLPRSSTGSRRDVGFRGRFYADIATRREKLNPLFPLYVCQEQWIGGLYEVEPITTYFKAIIQLYTYILAANSNGFTTNGRNTFQGIKWTAGTGLAGYKKTIYALRQNNLVQLDAEYAEPGIILITERLIQANYVKHPTQKAGVQLYPNLPVVTPSPKQLPVIGPFTQPIVNR